MSEIRHVTVLLAYRDGAEPPPFGAGMTCLGGEIVVVQFGDLFAESEALGTRDRDEACLEGQEEPGPRHVTVLLAYKDGADLPSFGAGMTCLGGEIAVVQFGDLFAEFDRREACFLGEARRDERSDHDPSHASPKTHWGRHYRGITHAVPRWLLFVWKRLFCRMEWHAFDEVASVDRHYLSCDACGLVVDIKGINSFDQVK